MKRPSVLAVLAALAAAAVAGYGLYLYDGASAPERLYDADLNRLAVSAREGYCSGQVWMESQGHGDSGAAADCRERSSMDEEWDLQAVLGPWCRGAISRGLMGFTELQCVDVLRTQRLWPTVDGRLSAAFTSSHPYPGDVFRPVETDGGDDSRTGDRPVLTR